MTSLVSQTLYRRLPRVAQDWIVALAGWRSYRARFGAPFRRALAELTTTDFADADAIRADQDRRLRALVTTAAAEVPYYRDLFRREGIDPATIRTVDDLKRIPFLDKETVRRVGIALKSEAVPMRDVVPAHTSGTTGTALRLYHTRQALGWEYAVIWRQRGWFDCSRSDRFACFTGQMVVPVEQEKPPYWRYDWARRRMLFSLYHMSDAALDDYVEELRRPGYRFWQGYPSSIALVCEHLLRRGIDLGEAAPAVVFTSSETLLHHHRQTIERATRARVADRYGNSEFSVSALQCPEGTYHIDTEFGVVEIDPHEETDEWVRGEVVTTGFANRAMPLIRYRTGDVATLRKRVRCGCGRKRPELEEIDGRIEDYILTPDGRRIGRTDHVFKDALLVQEAQIVQESLHDIVVRLVPRPGFGPSHARDLEEQFRKRMGQEIRIRFEHVPRIERAANGKFRAVVSHLPDSARVRVRR